jgi:aminoglycoside phosphotransferase
VPAAAGRYLADKLDGFVQLGFAGLTGSHMRLDGGGLVFRYAAEEIQLQVVFMKVLHEAPPPSCPISLSLWERLYNVMLPVAIHVTECHDH